MPEDFDGCHFRKPADKQGDKWMDLGLLGEGRRLVIIVASRPLHQYKNFMILCVTSCSFVVCYQFYKKLSVSTFREVRKKPQFIRDKMVTTLINYNVILTLKTTTLTSTGV